MIVNILIVILTIIVFIIILVHFRHSHNNANEKINYLAQKQNMIENEIYNINKLNKTQDEILNRQNPDILKDQEDQEDQEKGDVIADAISNAIDDLNNQPTFPENFTNVSLTSY